MAKTLIDVDEQYLAAAQEALHTETKKDTVNAALREVAALAADALEPVVVTARIRVAGTLAPVHRLDEVRGSRVEGGVGNRGPVVA